MLRFDFNGFEGFKERFGIQEHGNGSKSRKNKILLAFVKDQFQKKNYEVINFKTMTEMQVHVWAGTLSTATFTPRIPIPEYVKIIHVRVSGTATWSKAAGFIK